MTLESDAERCISTHWSLPVRCVLVRAHRENWHEGWHENGNRLRYRYPGRLTEQLHDGAWHDLGLPVPTALHRLRGILAATMPGAAIDTLIAEVRAEWDEQQAPIPYALIEPSPVVRAADQTPPSTAGSRHTTYTFTQPDGSAMSVATTLAIDPTALAAEPAPRPLWIDVSTVATHGRLCGTCTLEIHSSDPDWVAQEMEKHLAEQHGRASTIQVVIEQQRAAGLLLDPIRRATEGGR